MKDNCDLIAEMQAALAMIDTSVAWEADERFSAVRVASGPKKGDHVADALNDGVGPFLVAARLLLPEAIKALERAQVEKG